jgi:hypothetical protein
VETVLITTAVTDRVSITAAMMVRVVHIIIIIDLIMVETDHIITTAQMVETDQAVIIRADQINPLTDLAA